MPAHLKPKKLTESEFADAPRRVAGSFYTDPQGYLIAYFQIVGDDGKLETKGPYRYLTMQRFTDSVRFQFGLTGRRAK